MNSTSKVTPPNDLEGHDLPNGWSVGPKIIRTGVEGATGGHFSVGYECSSPTGVRAFLKAIDLHTAIQNSGGDVIKVLQGLTQVVQAEKELLNVCLGMDRVVNVLDTGDITVLRGSKLDIPVPYIIFERADSNARSVVFDSTRPPHGWCLRTLHQIAVGLYQLHGSMISHQDLKLSNVLLFDQQAGAKISDLGRSVQQGRRAPQDSLEWPGDWSYAPPEIFYGYRASEFNVLRFASDLYLLGSCACTIFTGLPTNALLYMELPADLRAKRLPGGSYTGTFEGVLPHLKAAFESALSKVRAAIDKDAPYRNEIVTMIEQWCDPDPTERGHPRTRAIVGTSGNVYNLERYLSTLDVLATKAARFDNARMR